MDKGVYSIVLSDDVVAEVDRLAYRRGTSRSNMINQILAEYVSYVTPEKRLSDIFSRTAELIGLMDELQVMSRPSDTMLSIKSALSYKYNPTVRYSVELYKSGGDLGELRVSLRTQNAALISLMNDFYYRWDSAERRLLGDDIKSTLGGGRYARILRRPQSDSGEEVAGAIVDYVEALDRAMKGYFACVNNGRDPSGSVEDACRGYSENNTLLL